MDAVARELTIHELLRCQHVKRWHIVHTDREQTVAEHLWAVTMLGRELYKRMEFAFPYEMWLELLLLHDSTESITGDLPTPSKKFLVDSGSALGYDISKNFAAIDIWGRSYDGGLPNAALKCVDLIEAIRHMDIHGRGAHAISVRRLLFNALHDHVDTSSSKWPLHRWYRVHQLFNDSLSGPDGLQDGRFWGWS